MSNQLTIPSKKTASSLPIKSAVREYIRVNHPDTHPDAFTWDIDRWEQLRREATENVIRATRVDALFKYNAQLSYVSTKLPDDIGLDVPFLAAFKSPSPWLTLPSLAYERCAILFNLAALYSQLAHSEDRSHSDGIKRASGLYQSSAGVLNHAISTVIPALLKTTENNFQDNELTEAILRGLEYLMLAQAQECAWQLAVMDRFKNALIAKLAAGVSHFYRMCAATVGEALPAVKQAFPTEWLAHAQTKALHFEAAAQYRMSLVDLEQHRYGHEIARLTEAKRIAQNAYDNARRQLVARPVLNDVKSLIEIVEKNFTRAERDNDLIYHQDIPAPSTLSSIDKAVLVSSNVPKELSDPKDVIGNDGVLFSELVGWGARVAVEIYQHRRENWLKEEVYNRAIELDDIAAKTLNELRLPASLEALDKPVGLPPSLLRKAEEVRLEDGPSRIDGSFEAVEVLAERNRAILDEAMDLLDQEASEDEGIRRSYANSQKPWDRTPSYEANVELTSKEKRYRQLLDQAAESDERVREKWNSWESTIMRLTWKEADLERWVPRSTAPHPGRNDPQNAQAQTHARALRGHLETLEDVRKSRAQLVERVQRLVEADDIRPRIMREESNIARWVEVTPSMFEMTITEEMEKYDRFKDDVEEGALKQEEVLDHIKARNEQFLQSRKEDKLVKDREHALQSLDLAYYKYREIVRNLEEGLNFYNDLARILTGFREACKEWVRVRRDEMRGISHMLDSMSLPTNEDDVSTPKSRPRDLQASSPEPSHAALARNSYFDLPPPDSDEWESLPPRHQ